jgi:hypothetical protein
MSRWVLGVLLVLTGTAASAQTSAITIRSQTACQVYLVETTIDVDTALKEPSGGYQYQTPGTVRSGGVKTVERLRPLGATPVTVDVGLGTHVFQVDTGRRAVSITVEATGQPQVWRVDVPSGLVGATVGWGLLGGLGGMMLLDGPSYIESERNQNGFGRIGFAVSGFAVIAVLVGGVIFDNTNAVREQ